MTLYILFDLFPPLVGRMKVLYLLFDLFTPIGVGTKKDQHFWYQVILLDDLDTFVMPLLSVLGQWPGIGNLQPFSDIVLHRIVAIIATRKVSEVPLLEGIKARHGDEEALEIPRHWIG